MAIEYLGLSDIKYDVPNDHLELFDDYRAAVDEFYNKVLEKNA